VKCGTHRSVTWKTKGANTPISAGFTFLELVIVILILGIITMMALPAMNDFFTEEALNGAADAVVAAIYYARSAAITTNADHGVVFSSTSNSFRVMRALGTPSEESYVTVEHPAAKRDYEVSFDDGPIGKGVDLCSAQFGETSYVRFNNLGTPLVTGFVLLEYGGKSRTIEVMATSCEISS
jgi:prepilin-type N-terminal cleavage/methylation domain-containing protein